MSEKLKMCIASWKGLSPDYKFTCWNESNSPTDIPYLKTALKNKNWANASNFMRLYALSSEGGIYLDTDVQLLRPLDCFLDLGCFLGFQYNPADELSYVLEESLNNAVFGCESDHPVLLESLSDIIKNFDGLESAAHSSPRLISKIFIRHGLREYSDVPLRLGDASIFPTEYFYPYFHGQEFHLSCLTDKTHAIHHWDASWIAKAKAETSAEIISALRQKLSVSKAEQRITKNEIRTLRRKLSKSRVEKKAILSSTSWKITAPLRAVVGAIQDKGR